MSRQQPFSESTQTRPCYAPQSPKGKDNRLRYRQCDAKVSASNPQHNKNSTFHIDHIYPKAKFTPKNKALSPDYLEDKNYLFNLQLLEGSENISKIDADPDVWIREHFDNDASKINDYKEKNYIDASCTMEWADFKTFKDK